MVITYCYNFYSIDTLFHPSHWLFKSHSPAINSSTHISISPPTPSNSKQCHGNLRKTYSYIPTPPPSSSNPCPYYLTNTSFPSVCWECDTVSDCEEADIYSSSSHLMALNKTLCIFTPVLECLSKSLCALSQSKTCVVCQIRTTCL